MVRSAKVLWQQNSLRNSSQGCRGGVGSCPQKGTGTAGCWELHNPCMQLDQVQQSLMLQQAAQGNTLESGKLALPLPAFCQCPLLRSLTFGQLAKDKYFRVQFHYHGAIALELRGNNLITGTWNIEPGIPQLRVF